MLSSRIAVEAVNIKNVSERIMDIYLSHACRPSVHASNAYARRHHSRTHVVGKRIEISETRSSCVDIETT